MLIVVAPALIAASTQRHRKSCSVRVASSADHSTSSVWLRARGDRGEHLLQNRVGLHLQLVLHVHRRGGDEGVDAEGLGVAQRLGGAVDVLDGGARQTAGHGIVQTAGDLGDRLEVALGGDREAGLDHVDTQGVEQCRRPGSSPRRSSRRRRTVRRRAGWCRRCLTRSRAAAGVDTFIGSRPRVSVAARRTEAMVWMVRLRRRNGVRLPVRCSSPECPPPAHARKPVGAQGPIRRRSEAERRARVAVAPKARFDRRR